ncbi:MAG: hypothetical protein AB7K37_14240 [Cyclobacteriaceae bacterium]
MRKKTLLIVIIALYALTYLAFRSRHIEKWDQDGHRYVIFPRDSLWIYYLYRPLTYLDGQLTGMRFHIGPHHATTVIDT